MLKQILYYDSYSLDLSSYYRSKSRLFKYTLEHWCSNFPKASGLWSVFLMWWAWARAARSMNSKAAQAPHPSRATASLRSDLVLITRVQGVLALKNYDESSWICVTSVTVKINFLIQLICVWQSCVLHGHSTTRIHCKFPRALRFTFRNSLLSKSQ
jgi:hypothetical protein